MADLSDVLNALASTALTALYPGGGSGQTPISAAGLYVRVMLGWPNGEQLEADMEAGFGEVAIYPREDETNTTRFARDWQETGRNPQTLTVNTVGNVVTWSGVPTAGLQVALIVNGKPYAYLVQTGDTLSSIAATMAALVVVDTPATAYGSAATIPGTTRIVARLGSGGTAAQEVGRQRRGFQIVVCAPSPALRDAIAKVLDPAFRALSFLPLADGSAGRMIYVSSPLSDTAERSLVYRRDLIYSVEYPTTLSQAMAEITLPVSTVAPSIPALTPPAPAVPGAPIPVPVDGPLTSISTPVIHVA